MAEKEYLKNGNLGLVVDKYIFIGTEEYPNRIATLGDLEEGGGGTGAVSSVNGETGAVVLNLQKVTTAGNTTTLGIGAQFLQLDTNPSNEEEIPGKIYYDDEADALKIVHISGSVENVGQKFFMPPTNNNSGTQINAGEFVMATGATGERITIAKAVTNGTVDAMFMIGFADRNIPSGSELGKVVTNGTIRGLNTNAWAVGTVLYPDPLTPGGLTSTKPISPAIKTPIAIVLKQNSNSGIIYVRMTNGSRLGDTDSNVEFVNLDTGQTIRYNGTIWENTNKFVIKNDGSVGIEKDITLNNGSTAVPSTDLGIRINRGTSNTEAAILWKEGVKYWIAKDTDTTPGQAEKKIAVEWDVLDGGTWS